MILTLGQVADFTAAKGAFDPNSPVKGYSIDSRTLQPGDIFFAIAGEHFDGHDFVLKAFDAGASAAVVNQSNSGRYTDHSRLLLVNDTLKALQALAHAVRELWGKTLIAITGSTGKTTTKEAIAAVLGTEFKVLKSAANLNNQVGLPLQLLNLEEFHQIAVVEMGMSHAGEIAHLAKIAHPDLGVVTNIAPVHLDYFSSLDDIARAKYELLANMPASGIAFLNIDDPYLAQFGRDFHGKVTSYGFNSAADVRAEAVKSLGLHGSSFNLVAKNTPPHQIKVPLLGLHNVYNALAAAAVGLSRDLLPEKIAAGLATLRPSDKRGQTLTLRGATLINDCYNSNPVALNSMVDTLASIPAKRRIVIAGEMLELGPTAADLHRGCGQHMAQKQIDIVIGVRGLAHQMVEGAAEKGLVAEFVETPEQTGEWLNTHLTSGDVVLLKASRGVGLEKALEVLTST